MVLIRLTFVSTQELDLDTCKTKDLEFTSEFELVNKSADVATTLTALVGYFDVSFVLAHHVVSFSDCSSFSHL